MALTDQQKANLFAAAILAWYKESDSDWLDAYPPRSAVGRYAISRGCYWNTYHDGWDWTAAYDPSLPAVQQPHDEVLEGPENLTAICALLGARRGIVLRQIRERKALTELGR